MHSIFIFCDYMVYFNTSASKIASITYNLLHVISTCNMLLLPTFEHLFTYQASLVTQMVKNLPVMQETQVRSLGWEGPLEKGMATHPSVLAWEIHGQRSLMRYSPWGHKRVG